MIKESFNALEMTSAIDIKPILHNFRRLVYEKIKQKDAKLNECNEQFSRFSKYQKRATA